MNRSIFFIALLSAAVFHGGAAELVSYQLDEDRLEVVSGEPIERPLRQIRYAQSVPAPHTEPPLLLTLGGINEELTQKYIEQYSRPGGIKWLSAIMERGEPYLGFIRGEIEKRNMPAELVYLPVIESAYSTAAVSRSGATGLWQFMRNSIGPYDMRINEWMDERRDFWKSTLGALNKLEDEYKRVGSWELALASYNAGIGTVLKAQKKYPGADYWELCEKRAFKNETIQYIPRLLAVSYILSNPRRFGMEIKWPENPQWTRIPVGRSVDLGLVAEYAGLPGADLKKANSELFYGITPPDSGYHIKVPSSQAESVALVLEDPDLPLIRYYFHTIRRGDTLSELARHYGISVNQIAGSNPGLQPRYLKIGQRLMIPAFREPESAGPRQNRVPEIAAAGEIPFAGTHLVKRGESLWSIALAYNVNPETLASANGMGLNDTLNIGRALRIPAGR
ncbi:MAG: LysM peptidoglycan-binding domain-containing protein [Treponema sp.]|jgi:membrane-bound lytic murein transglycosylase D|nr:LysM peptidoglycan-binding domain-containing protein [Treponema sp.]